MSKLENISKKVEFVLATLPESRNNDIVLLIAIWERYYRDELTESRNGELYVKLSKLHDLPREDHVKRVRAKIQNVERRYLPTDKNVLIERAKDSGRWRAYLGYTKYWKDQDWENAVDNVLNKVDQASLL